MSAPPTDPPRRNGKRADADDTMPTLSIVEQTMGEARRALALALMVCGFVIAALLAERAWFSVAFESVNARLAQAQVRTPAAGAAAVGAGRTGYGARSEHAELGFAPQEPAHCG